MRPTAGVLILILVLTVGCGGPGTAPPSNTASRKPAAITVAEPVPQKPSARASPPAPASQSGVVAPEAPRESARVEEQGVLTSLDGVPPRAPAIDETRVADAGIHTLTGEHLTLYTDLPIGPVVEQLVSAFDQAYPQWCEYFHIPPDQDPPWRVTACVMVDKERFARVGLLPADLPPFPHGYCRGRKVWIREQPDDYYRRHLLLHEGTHAFMNDLVGGLGPTWFAEGMAELLATHALVDGRLRLNAFPSDAKEVPGWGRIRLLREETAKNGPRAFDDILGLEARDTQDVKTYARCWGAAAFLDGHPRYRERFRQLPVSVTARDFNREFRALFAADWQQLCEEWQVFASQAEYGYDLERAAIDFLPGKPLPAGGDKVEVAADRGWQSTGILLEADHAYRLRATGRYQVATDSRPWLSEPEGVSIRYYAGEPLGVLMGAVLPEKFDQHGQSGLAAPLVIGREALLRPRTAGTLYLRINDSPAELTENAGSVTVQVTEE